MENYVYVNIKGRTYKARVVKVIGSDFYVAAEIDDAEMYVRRTFDEVYDTKKCALDALKEELFEEANYINGELKRLRERTNKLAEDTERIKREIEEEAKKCD